jgi:hypothetical protein
MRYSTKAPLAALITCVLYAMATPIAAAVPNASASGAGSHQSTNGKVEPTTATSSGAAVTAATCSATGSNGTAVFRPDALTGSAINAAIRSAAANPNGGVVNLAAGTYLTDRPIVVASNVRLTGAGAALTTVKASSSFLRNTGPNGGHPLITTSGASNVTISNLTADQSGDVLNGNVPDRLAAYLVDVRKSRNVVVDRVHTRNPFTYSVMVMGSNGFCVRDSQTRVTTSGRYDQLDGIHILDSSYGDVLNNDVDQRVGTDGDDGLVAHTIYGPSVHDIRFVGNRVRGGNNGDGMQLAVGNYPIYNLTIEANEIYDSPFGIRTGYYDNGTGAVYGIKVTSNNVHDLRGGHAFPTGGNAINIGGFGARSPVTNVVAANNRACRAGTVTVVPGQGNMVTGTTGC